MSTRSNMAHVREDGTTVAVYHHWDGYLDGLGQTLVDLLGGQTEERRKFIIDKLMAEQVGWSTINGYNIDLEPSWVNSGWRDDKSGVGPQSYTARGEKNSSPRPVYGSKDEYLRSLYGDVFIEYTYIFIGYDKMEVYELRDGDHTLYPGDSPGYHQVYLGTVDFTADDLKEDIGGHRKSIELIIGYKGEEEE